MTTDTRLCADPSPEILCVSDGHETATKIRETVASHRPTATIETTTDPTVVPELIVVWDIDCVVAAAEMQPLSGAELQSTVRKCIPQTAVILVSIESTAHESGVTVVADDTTERSTELPERLDGVHTQRDVTKTSDPGQSVSSRLDRLSGTNSRCDLLSELDTVVSELSTVLEHRLWLVDGDGSLEPAEETDPTHTTVPSAVREAIETGTPQQVAERNTATDESTPMDRTELGRTVAHPIGKQGVLWVEYATFTPLMTNRVRRLTTVTGVYLDHYATIADLESRFRLTAERNRTLSQFARTVAHDLNSPLSVIYGRIELALADQTEAEMHLQAARNAAQRVDSLITDHLQSIETIDTESEREPVSVQTVAIQAWRIIDPSTARLQVEPQLETVEANAIRLQQLFENLIRNAIEHGSEESVGLGASHSRDPHAVFDDDTDSVTVTIKPTDCGFAVCDDGPGVPPAERDEIFESGYTTTESGSGLGLHIVQEIVDAHDWEISVTESENGGARFEVDTQ